jgi:hypothetical protein
VAKTDIDWDADAPTLSIDVKFNAGQMKQLLAGDWVRIEEVTAKTLHEVAGAMLTEEPSDPKQAEIDDLVWEQARLRYYIEALERCVSQEQRQAAAAEAYYEVSQHDTPARARERATSNN